MVGAYKFNNENNNNNNNNNNLSDWVLHVYGCKWSVTSSFEQFVYY